MNTRLNHHQPVNIVIASAGTGKTTALVQEIQKAIDEGIPASWILGTTFTNKAAEELIERTRAHLIGAGKSEQAAGLYAARVGTVNATFGKIVSEFALDAGRSPVADVISEHRQKRMFSTSAEAAITRHSSMMIPIAQRLDIEDWEDDVRQLADLVRQNDVAPASLSEHAEQSWQGFKAIFPEPLAETAEVIDQALRDSLDQALSDLESGSDETKTTATVTNQIREAIAILDSGRELPWIWWTRLAKLKPGKSSTDLVAPVVTVAGGHAAHPRLHADLEHYIRGVYETAADALEIYTTYKASNGLVDFVDQEHEALRLLENDDVRARLRETLSRVYVDEFQDTSPIQLALFLRISQIANRSFWVGDPKQAIYGFRGSDPELIVRAADKIVPESGGDRATLGISYRSRPGLVAFANRSFGPAFEAIGFAPETTRINECARSDREDQRLPIEVWGLSGSNWDKAIAALAENVRSVLESSDACMVEDRATGSSRRLRGSDIAILCRSNDRCGALSAALAARGLPVSIARPGLLETPEAALAIAAFRYLVDPRDSLAIAEIAHLLDDGQGQPSWLESGLSDDGIWSLREDLPALKVLDEQREDLAYLTPREALAVAMSGSAILDRVLGWDNPLDRIANLDALRGLAAQYEDEARTLRSAATATGLVVWLASLAGSNDELPASTDPDAVNVLTYHRSKGLEWPMVILLDLENARDGSAFGFTVEAGEEFDVWRPLDGRWVRFWPWPYGAQRKDVHIDATVFGTEEHLSATQREHAEAVRLLYVGATRARDYLVLAPRHSDKRGLQTGWPDHLVATDGRPLLNFLRAESDNLLVVDNHEIPVAFSLLTADDVSAETQPTTERYCRVPAPANLPVHPPYRIVPSAAAPGSAPASIVTSRVRLGARIPMSGSPDMNHLGEAVHAFLALDRAAHALEARKIRAAETLERWGITAIAPDELLTMSDRISAHLGSNYPGMTIRVEVPVFAKRGGQRLYGRIDLLLTDDDKAIVIDHKSYPGAYETWEEKAIGYGGQIAAYAAVVREATGSAEVETWVHMPVVGQLLQIRTEV